MFSRRRFLQCAPLAAVAGAASCRSTPPSLRSSKSEARLLFVSQGRTAIIHADGTGLRYLEFDRPGQVTWQPVGFFSDGRRILLLSMEARRDGPGRPFAEYYHQTPTHVGSTTSHRGHWRKSPRAIASRCSMRRNSCSTTTGSSCRSFDVGAARSSA